MLQSGQGHQIIQTANGQQIVVQSGQSIQVRYQLASCVKKSYGTMQKTVTKLHYVCNVSCQSYL
jgi:hypothetical protein